MDFNFTHFANFKFVYFEIKVNLGKLTKLSISLANFYFGYLKGARFKYIFWLILCINEILGKFG